MKIPSCAACAALLVMALGTACLPAIAQENPVYVDDSPQAWQQFRQARDQVAENPGEAIRGFQELLDIDAARLVPVREGGSGQFVSVRQRVLTELLDERLLQRYQLIEQAQAQRLLDDEELERLVLTRSLTAAGLEGLLRLAQRNLESGRFASALSWARQAAEHPLRTGDHSAHAQFMLGLAALHLEDADSVLHARQSLEPGAGRAVELLRRELDRHIAAPPRPRQTPGVMPFDSAAAAGLDRLVGEPIWVQPLDESLWSRWIHDAGEGVTSNPNFRRDHDEGDFLTAIPAVAGPLVYVNQGHRVLAFNRFTECLTWTYPRDTPVIPMDRDIADVGDMNIVSVAEGALVTLTGHAVRDTRAGHGAVICLDPSTGELRWSARVDQLGLHEDLNGLFPHGAPVIADGMVFVLTRKLSPQQLTSCYVIALDLASGALRWARHVASCGGIQNRLSRPFSSVVVDRGDVIVATSVGAVARLDAVTGLTHWLQRFAAPVASGSTEHAPWEIGGPVITRRGLILLQPDERSVVLLDRRSGDQLEAHATLGTWGDPRYFLADAQRVYAIERESLRAFSLDQLAEPLWTASQIIVDQHEVPARDDEDAKLGTPAGEILTLRGRVQLVGGALIVPTSLGIVMLDSETGTAINRLPLAMGNPLAVDHQLLVAGDDRLEAYMPLDSAEAMLRERMASAPADAAPALALARLGMRAGRVELALEAAELAWNAIGARGAPAEGNRLHAELFEMLLAMHHHTLAASDREAETLHARIEAVALYAAQRLEYHLVRGQWLESRRLVEAVEAYQGILSDDQLAATIRADLEVRRNGADWARQGLADLIARHGASAYAPQSALAQLALDQLLAEGAAPESLMKLAAEYPLSAAAREAALEASTLHVQRGEGRRAIAVLTSALRWNADAQTGRFILGALVERCLEQRWTHQARAILEHAIQTYGEAPLATALGPRSPGEWMKALDAGEPDRRPLLSSAGGEARWLGGQLVPWCPSAKGLAPPDRVIIAEGDLVTMLTAPDLAEAWSTPRDESGFQLLAINEDDVDLWSASNPGEPHLIRLNARDGTERWTTPRLNERLPPVFNPIEGPAQMPSGEAFQPSETLPFISETALFLVRRSGGILALSTTDGDTELWTRPRTLDQVYVAVLHEYGLVLAGARGHLDSARGFVPTIMVLDPASGSTLFEFSPEGSSVRWLAITALGALAYGTGEGVTLVDLLSGGSLWSSTTAAAREARQGWAFGEHLITEDHLAGMADLRSHRVSDGVMSGPFDAPIRGGWTPSELMGVLHAGEHVYAHYSDRIARYDFQGVREGADVVSDKRDYRWVLRGRDEDGHDRLLVVSMSEAGQIPTEERERRTVYRYRMYLLAEDGRLLGDPLSLDDLAHPIRRAGMIDGWLLFSTDDSRALPTLAVPLHAEP